MASFTVVREIAAPPEVVVGVPADHHRHSEPRPLRTFLDGVSAEPARCAAAAGG